MKFFRKAVVAGSVCLACFTCSPLQAGDSLQKGLPRLATAGDMLIVVGAPGGSQYGRQFAVWADRWRSAGRAGQYTVEQIGPNALPSSGDSGRNHRELLELSLRRLGERRAVPLWLILIGHGTFDGRSAKLNLHGPDVAADELVEWLPTGRRCVIICCQSSSGPFLEKLAGGDRVIITATKSGHEQNFARFGDFLSRRVADTHADLDKDGQTSLLEAFLQASRDTAAFYRDAGRLATEHALLEDNGDGVPVRADDFRGVQPADTSSELVPDGQRAHQMHLVPNHRERRLSAAQRARRDKLEQAVFAHRRRRPDLGEEEYLAELERLLVPLAQLYAEVEADSASDARDGPAVHSGGVRPPAAATRPAAVASPPG